MAIGCSSWVPGCPSHLRLMILWTHMRENACEAQPQVTQTIHWRIGGLNQRGQLMERQIVGWLRADMVGREPKMGKGPFR